MVCHSPSLGGNNVKSNLNSILQVQISTSNNFSVTELLQRNERLARITGMHSIASRFLLAMIVVSCIAVGASAFQTPEIERNKSVSVGNLKQLALATVMYSQDFDNKFPQATTIEGIQKSINPYLRNQKSFKSPKGEAYLFNFILSGTDCGKVTAPQEMVLFYEASAWPDKSRGVAFTDGHVKMLSEAEFRKAEKTIGGAKRKKRS